MRWWGKHTVLYYLSMAHPTFLFKKTKKSKKTKNKDPFKNINIINKYCLFVFWDIFLECFSINIFLKTNLWDYGPITVTIRFIGSI